MIYARVINGTIYDLAPLDDLFPNTSWPSTGVSTEFLQQENLQAVAYTKSYDTATQKLITVPAYLEAGTVYAVDVVALTSEELAARSASIVEQNRQQAQRLLQETDWTQLADVELANKQEFASYRNQLRAIIFNTTVDITWPTKPQEVWP